MIITVVICDDARDARRWLTAQDIPVRHLHFATREFELKGVECEAFVYPGGASLDLVEAVQTRMGRRSGAKPDFLTLDELRERATAPRRNT